MKAQTKETQAAFTPASALEALKAGNQRFVNNQRYHAAFGHRINPKVRYEMHYIWQKSRNLSDEGFRTGEHIIRLRVYYLLRKAPDEITGSGEE